MATSIPTKAQAVAALYQTIRTNIINDLNYSVASKQPVDGLDQASLSSLQAEFTKKAWHTAILIENIPVVNGPFSTAVKQVKFLVVS